MQRVFVARVRPLKLPFGTRLARVAKVKPAVHRPAREFPPALDPPAKPGVQARFMG